MPQRRHANLDAAQPIEQIGAEQPAIDEPRQRAIRRGDDPRVDLPRAAAADALDRQVLDDAQQLGLRGHRQIGDLVEKQRAAVGVLELAAPSAHAGRGPLLDAEQLRFDQRLDQRRAIDGDEWSLPARTELVNLARHQLLADAALAFDRAR